MSEQQPQGQPPQQPQTIYVERPSSGMAVASLVCGIIGAIIALIPLLGIFGLALGLVAFILGIIGWRKAKKGEARGKGMAITGAILGAIAIALGIFGMTIVGDALNDIDDAFQQLDEDLQDLGG